MKKNEEAVLKYSQGMNCAQAVLSAFQKNCNISEEEAVKIGAGLGAGMCSGDACGAVTSGVILIGLKYGGASKEEKMAAVSKTKEYLDSFKEWGSSTNCIKLKRESGKSCSDIVKHSASLLENIL